MIVKTFQTEKYRDCPVYYRNLHNHFEYLTIIENQIYTAHISVRPAVISLLLYKLGIAPARYSNQQVANVLKLLKRMSETTIDTILDKDKKK